MSGPPVFPFPSRNFNWWRAAARRNPYGRIGDLFADLPKITDAADDEATIASANAAAAAYARLQDKELEPALRQATECALKRYCELDTLAMAMWWRLGALGVAGGRPKR
jgi:hypothetical protein